MVLLELQHVGLGEPVGDRVGDRRRAEHAGGHHERPQRLTGDARLHDGDPDEDGAAEEHAAMGDLEHRLLRVVGDEAHGQRPQVDGQRRPAPSAPAGRSTARNAARRSAPASPIASVTLRFERVRTDPLRGAWWPARRARAPHGGTRGRWRRARSAPTRTNASPGRPAATRATTNWTAATPTINRATPMPRGMPPRKPSGARIVLTRRKSSTGAVGWTCIEPALLTYRRRGEIPDPGAGHDPATQTVKVLRIYHSGVVAAWRRREAELARRGAEVVLVSPVAWNEGGEVVELGTADGAEVVRARTWGRHPYVFVYDPRPLWRALRGPASTCSTSTRNRRASPWPRCSCWPAWPVVGRGSRCASSAPQNIEKRYPRPFRWLEQPGPAAGRRGAHLQRRGRSDPAPQGLQRASSSNLGLGVDVDRFGPAPRPRAAR